MKIATGTSVIFSCKHVLEGSFYRGFAGSPEWRVFVDVLCVVFIQSKGEIFHRHTVEFLLTSNTKIVGQKATVWTRTCALPFPSFFFFSTAHFPRLLSHFSPCSAACLCLVSAIAGNFPQGLALSRIVECLYSVRYRSDSMAVRTFQYFGHSPF